MYVTFDSRDKIRSIIEVALCIKINWALAGKLHLEPNNTTVVQLVSLQWVLVSATKIASSFRASELAFKINYRKL